ncbi:hypothetical protein [Xanthocytophaga agilis]|uniref:Uncharacterized protein n=1 Tax=Xanthocytophaga agilis TaxID=3048010 RepID=A0AAE3RCM8_9BACT|nr:hypothetical protein [Xanthocytophaga agilis]MDJ1505178.1 hypothetical protein [Xanthocytophaga agilis]
MQLKANSDPLVYLNLPIDSVSRGFFHLMDTLSTYKCSCTDSLYKDSINLEKNSYIFLSNTDTSINGRTYYRFRMLDDKTNNSYFDYVGWKGDTLLYRVEGYAALAEKVFTKQMKKPFYFPDSLKDSNFLIFTNLDTITWNSNNPTGFSGLIKVQRPEKNIKGHLFKIFSNKVPDHITSHSPSIHEIYANKQLGIIFFNYNDGERTYDCWLDKPNG